MNGDGFWFKCKLEKCKLAMLVCKSWASPLAPLPLLPLALLGAPHPSSTPGGAQRPDPPKLVVVGDETEASGAKD